VESCISSHSVALNPPPRCTAATIHPTRLLMKKYSLLAITITSLVFAGFSYAQETKVENKPGKCCVKAETDGKTCTHECCVTAAKAGNNCTKCGGSGVIEQKAAAKKKGKK
jgi:hypothetical protein